MPSPSVVGQACLISLGSLGVRGLPRSLGSQHLKELSSKTPAAPFPCLPRPWGLTGCLCFCLVPPGMGDRTESVAEKMLTNWFTFLLYKFLKVGLAVGISLDLPQSPHRPGHPPASSPACPLSLHSPQICSPQGQALRTPPINAVPPLSLRPPLRDRSRSCLLPGEPPRGPA